MKKAKKSVRHKTLDEDLQLLLKKSDKGPISLEEIFEIFSEKGRFFFLIFLSLPFCQPIQIPGISFLFGIVIAFMGIRVAFGHHVWLPKRILKKTLSPETIKKLVHKSSRIIKKMRKWIHPRLQFVCQPSSMQIVNGIVIALLGLFLALPLPIPFTNILVGWPLLLISLGLLEDDGLLVIIGYILSLICFVFFTAIVVGIFYYKIDIFDFIKKPFK